MEALLPHSLDVYYTSIHMKKNRPAYCLHVLCEKEQEGKVLEEIFQHSSSIGVRKYDVERVILKRKIEEIRTPWGKARVKKVFFQGDTKAYPEYEDVRRIALKEGLGFLEVFAAIKEYAKEV